MENKLLELTQAYDNKTLAAKRGRFVDIDVFEVEPGDSTHYQVILMDAAGKVGATVVVGSIEEPFGGGVMMESKGVWIPVLNPSVYTQEIYCYLAWLALGLPCEEPEGLEYRRQLHNNNNNPSPSEAEEAMDRRQVT